MPGCRENRAEGRYEPLGRFRRTRDGAAHLQGRGSVMTTTHASPDARRSALPGMTVDRMAAGVAVSATLECAYTVVVDDESA